MLSTKQKEHFSKLFIKLIDRLPILLPAMLAAFGTVGIALLLLGRLDNILIWPFGIVASCIAFYLVWRAPEIKKPGSRREQIICNFLAIAGVLIWIIINFHYSSQNIFVYRDPAIYANTGAWLIKHNNLQIEVASVFGNLPGINGFSNGFGVDILRHGYVFAQGSHLLPLLLGLSARIGGTNFMLGLNSIIGGIALLAIYGFTRLLAKPKWALIVTATLAATLPFIYFSRDSYTEPLAAIFTFGALSLIWYAQVSRQKFLWMLAGLVAGAGCLTRIDGYISLIALGIFFVIMIALAKTKDHKQILFGAIAFITGAILPALLGWLDVARLSDGYYNTQRPQIYQEFIGLIAIAVVGIVVTIICWHTKLLYTIDKLTHKWRAQTAAVIVILIALFFASRPFWYIGHGSYLGMISGVQAAAGKTIDGTRNYAEQSAVWLIWYAGPVAIGLGLLGIVIATAKATINKNLLLIPGLCVVVVTSIIYLNQPSIAPDQIWAIRRFIPVIIPGIVVFGVLGIEWLMSKVNKKIPKLQNSFIAVLIVGALIPPLFISYPFLRAKTYGSQLQQIKQACQALPDRAAVIWIGETALTATQTTRSFCNIPATALVKPDKQQLQILASNVRESNHVPIIMIENSEIKVIPTKYKLVTVSKINYLTISGTLFTPPRNIANNNRAISIGQLQSDGSIKEINM